MRKTQRLIAVAACCAASMAASAAPKPPVQWSVKATPAALKPGGRFQVSLHGSIDPGWHLYALQEPDGGPVATEVALAENDPADLLRVEQSRPMTVLDPAFQLRTSFFSGSADFTLKLQAARQVAPGGHSLHVLVRYQSCDDRRCLPPHTDTVEVPISFQR